jgi:hypothetical protein
VRHKPIYLLWATANESIEMEDDVLRRDSLHALINDLPDANYATLRALTLVSFQRSCIFPRGY